MHNNVTVRVVKANVASVAPTSEIRTLAMLWLGTWGGKNSYDITLPQMAYEVKFREKSVKCFSFWRQQLCALLCSLRARLPAPSLQFFCFPPATPTTKTWSFSLPLPRFSRIVTFKNKLKWADSRWPRGSTHGSEAAGLFGLRLRIPPRGGMDVRLLWLLCVVR